MTARATPTAAVLNGPANQLICSTTRQQLIAALNSHVFSRDERRKGVAAAQNCQKPEVLAKWLRNTKELQNQREVELADECENGTYTNLDTSY